MNVLWIVFILMGGNWEMTEPALIFTDKQECAIFAEEQTKEIPKEFEGAKIDCFEYRLQGKPQP